MEIARGLVPGVMVFVLLDHFEDVVGGHASAVAVYASFLLGALKYAVGGLQSQEAVL